MPLISDPLAKNSEFMPLLTLERLSEGAVKMFSPRSEVLRQKLSRKRVQLINMLIEEETI